jgi:hypothetical protein
MAKPIMVEKKKFDALLRQMLKTPPLPREELRGKKSKSKTAHG